MAYVLAKVLRVMLQRTVLLERTRGVVVSMAFVWFIILLRLRGMKTVNVWCRMIRSFISKFIYKPVRKKKMHSDSFTVHFLVLWHTLSTCHHIFFTLQNPVLLGVSIVKRTTYVSMSITYVTRFCTVRMAVTSPTAVSGLLCELVLFSFDNLYILNHNHFQYSVIHFFTLQFQKMEPILLIICYTV